VASSARAAACRSGEASLGTLGTTTSTERCTQGQNTAAVTARRLRGATAKAAASTTAGLRRPRNSSSTARRSGRRTGVPFRVSGGERRPPAGVTFRSIGSCRALFIAFGGRLRAVVVVSEYVRRPWNHGPCNEQRVHRAMASRVVPPDSGEYVVSPEDAARMEAASERADETGEFFSWNPEAGIGEAKNPRTGTTRTIKFDTLPSGKSQIRSLTTWMRKPIICAPERRENIARPREHRPSTRRRARAPTGDEP
jgi:hypothetical protein